MGFYTRRNARQEGKQRRNPDNLGNFNNPHKWKPDTVSAAWEVFGDIDDYYPAEEIDDARRENWAESESAWDRLLDAAIDAAEEGDRGRTEKHLKDMSRVEFEWGDDPTTQKVCRALLGDRKCMLLHAQSE